MKRVGLDAIESADARVLILGAFPSDESLKRQEYYANPTNDFWWIMGEIAGAGPDLPYEERIRLLKECGIALWNVYKEAERAGSGDSTIRSQTAVTNDFVSFLSFHPHIELICFNGNTAEEIFRRKVHLPESIPAIRQIVLDSHVVVLDSTSGAHTIPRKVKLLHWRKQLGPHINAHRSSAGDAGAGDAGAAEKEIPRKAVPNHATGARAASGGGATAGAGSRSGSNGDTGRRLTLAFTGASGMLFGQRMLLALAGDARIACVDFIPSENSLRVLAEELRFSGRSGLVEKLLGKSSAKIHQLAESDIGAGVASGSFPSDGMIVLPCSMGTLAGIANGMAGNLIERAADVTLKEGRTLILCIRETPFNKIHLRNMAQAAEAGAIIFPVIPSFYNQPADINAMADQFACRVLQRIGLPQPGAYVWKGES